ncbi:hypothetical protein N9B73_13030, partial [Verrucomicrobiales bacterium]|nr:hypothetical protein [Verrucomicrobiales bacterium]
RPLKQAFFLKGPAFVLLRASVELLRCQLSRGADSGAEVSAVGGVGERWESGSFFCHPFCHPF